MTTPTTGTGGTGGTGGNGGTTATGGTVGTGGIGRPMLDRVHGAWEDRVLPALTEYTAVRCLSPAFDPDWEAGGHLVAAARLLADWCRQRSVPGLTAEVVERPGRTPVLVVEAPATGGPADTPALGGVTGPVLVYGHLDKQPPMGTWRDGLDPFAAVRDGDRLYGRGTADDGYSVFAAVTALEVLAADGVPRPRVVVLIEGSEESGSPDLPAHLDELADRIGRPDLVVCLDSGCLTYDRLWTTASLRGNLVATVKVEVLTEGVHSGLAGGVVPSSFRVLRRLLSRIEDQDTGEVLLPELRAEVPERHRADLAAVAETLPGTVAASLPSVPGLALAGSTEADRLVARAWAAAVAVTGMDGIPSVTDGGNVLRPYTTAKLSVRLPPSVDAARAAAALEAALTADPPEGARVTVRQEAPADGWLAPDPEPWVAGALEAASMACFDRPPSSYGEGGTIPFLAMLGARYPGVQLVATGVLGPGSNAHGPNEFLHLPMAEAVTVAVAELLAAAGRR
ncbi:MAG TPA: M20/M25/M40 family metallo-hydrolase [Acidimicrobiales bacterium]|nr:M20/M25/M40 family metallo-hydrolase [Acidimicrobiales bacterium]